MQNDKIDQSKIDKVNQMLALMQNDTVTPKVLEEFLVLVLSTIQKSKEGFESLSNDNLAKIQGALDYIQSEHEQIVSRVDAKNTSTWTRFEGKLQEVTKLLAEIKQIKATPGKDADEEKIISTVLSKIPAHECKVIECEHEEELGEDIVEKINELPIDDENLKIDASHIKNLPELTKTYGSNISKAIYQLSDVVLTNLSNNDVLKWDSTNKYWVNGTGGGGSSPLTTKGDLYTYTSADARLPVGSNYQFLQADSAATTGLRWATVSNGLTPASGTFKLGGLLTETTNINGASGGFNLLLSGEQMTSSAVDTMFFKTPGVNGGSATNGTFLKLVNATTGEVEFDTPTPGVTGSGTSGQVTYWNGTSSITGEAGFTYNDTLNILTVPTLSATTSIITPLTLGSVPFIGTSGLLTQDNTNFFWDDTNDILKIGGGTPTYTLGTNTLFTATKTGNTFITANIQNLSNGTTASTDLIINNDAATDTTNFLDIGISSSLNTDPLYTIAGAGQAYIWNTSEALAIGTAGAFPLKFFTGGTLAANEFMRGTSTGIVQIGTTTVTQGRVNITALSTTAPALNLRGAASMAGEILNIENSAGTDMFQVYGSGTSFIGLTFGTSVDTPSVTQIARIRSDTNAVANVVMTNNTANTNAAASFTLATSAASGAKYQLNSATNATYGGNSSLNLINQNNANLTLGTNDTVRVAITGAGSVNIGSVSLASGTNALSVTATQSATAAVQVGSLFSITGAGSDSNSHTGVRIEYLAGFTGSGPTRAVIGYNQNAGTGTNMALSSATTSPLGNIGVTGLADATTTGTNVGQWGIGENGNVNYGAGGRATIAKNSATNIGIAGFALNTGTSPIQVAGYFGLQNSTPTYTSAALIADNGSQTSPIFLGRDNGSVVLNLIDGGKMFLGGSTTPTATLHLKAGTATASTAPLKFTSGTNLTTAEAGAMEYDGTNLFFTRTGTTRENVLVAVDNATAPTTTATPVFTAYYGGNTNALGDPNRWISVNILGVVYKIPLYT